MTDLAAVAGFINEAAALIQKRVTIYDQQILSTLASKALSIQNIDRRERSLLAIDLAGTLSLARSQEMMNANEAFSWIGHALGAVGQGEGGDMVQARMGQTVETIVAQLSRNVRDAVQHYDNVLMRVRTMSMHSNMPIPALANLAFQKERPRVRFGNVDTLGRKGSDIRLMSLIYRAQLTGLFNGLVRRQMIIAGETDAKLYAPGHEYDGMQINLLPDGDIADLEYLNATVFHPGTVTLIGRKLTHE